jgi:hypothetical protein
VRRQVEGTVHRRADEAADLDDLPAPQRQQVDGPEVEARACRVALEFVAIR